jgi:hypothetical protein
LGALYVFSHCQACVITIVPEGKHVEQVFRDGTTGILSLEDVSGKLFLDIVDHRPSYGVSVLGRRQVAGDPRRPLP